MTDAKARRITELEGVAKQAYMAGYEVGHDATVDGNYGYTEELADDYVEEVLKESKGGAKSRESSTDN